MKKIENLEQDPLVALAKKKWIRIRSDPCFNLEKGKFRFQSRIR